MMPEQILAQPPRVLTQPQRASYFENGYLLVERLIPPDTVARLHALTAEFIERSKRETRSEQDLRSRARHSAARPMVRRLKRPDEQRSAVPGVRNRPDRRRGRRAPERVPQRKRRPEQCAPEGPPSVSATPRLAVHHISMVGLLLCGRRGRCRHTRFTAKSAGRPSSGSKASPSTGRPNQPVRSVTATRSQASRLRS